MKQIISKNGKVICTALEPSDQDKVYETSRVQNKEMSK